MNNFDSWSMFIGGALLTGFLATLAIMDIIPVPKSSNKHEGCTKVQSIKTDELQYCGKACWMPIYVNTYQCGTETKILIESAWEE